MCVCVRDRPGGHGSTQRGAAVDEDVPVAVGVGGALPALPRPRAFHLGQWGTETLQLTLQPFTFDLPELQKSRPHVLIGGQVGGHQVRMEARQAQKGPDRKEADHQLHCGGGGRQGGPTTANPG